MGQTVAVVIGSNSPIGRHLVNRLSQIRVRVVADPSMERPSELVEQLAGAEVLFHLTSSPMMQTRSAGEVARMNKVLLECAYQAEVGCIVHSSAATAMGFSERGDLVRDESTPARRRLSVTDRAVRTAEETALEFGEWTGQSVIAVRHALSISPWNEEGSLADYPIRLAMEGVMPTAMAGGLTIAHVQDLADGHVLAWRRGTSGDSYILGGQRVEIPAYVELVRELCPVASRPSEPAGGWWSRLRRNLPGRTAVDSPCRWEDLRNRYLWFTCQKASKELGYHDRPVEESISDIIGAKSRSASERRAA